MAAFVGLCLLLVAAVAEAARLTPLTIHLIAHTHDDVGWVKTVDECYLGANNSIQDAGVQYILDSVIPALEADAARRFSYVEIAFFERWWAEQSSGMRERVHTLVRSGQLEFINGGWCMHDEASTTAEAQLQQMARGHAWLWRTFQVRPRIGWQIDPFGHSSASATLDALFGFDALFFARIDYQDYRRRNTSGELEMVWQPSRSLDADASWLFTHAFYDTSYGYPRGFDFEADDPPINDDPRLFGVNVHDRAAVFAHAMRERASVFRTPHLLVMFGTDFRYSNANKNFKNMDKLRHYLNAHATEFALDVQWSTPSRYVDAVHAYAVAQNLTWGTKTDDFFPYADTPHSYWTGYFTSRAALKRYVRLMANELQSAQKLLAARPVHLEPNLAAVDVLARAFGVAQHHDAVSGTEKQHVADDYAMRLSIGAAAAEDASGDVLSSLVVRGASPPPKWARCPLLNVSECPALQPLAQGFVVPVVMFNSLAWNRSDVVVLPVPAANVSVFDGTGARVVAEMFQAFAQDPGPWKWRVAFRATLPAYGFATYLLQAVAGGPHPARPPAAPTAPSADEVLTNGIVSVSIDAARGRLTKFANARAGLELALAQDYLWYNASAGYMNTVSKQASGAYIFRPNRSEPFPVSSAPATVQVHRGALVQGAQMVWNKWVRQTVWLLAGAEALQVEATVGPVPIADHLGKEVIVRYNVSVASERTWWTDANGLEMQARVRDHRDTWTLNVTEPVAGNYYPVDEAIFIRDAARQFTVLTDRSKGGSSLASGSVETMHQRRLLYDDRRGVVEPLNESAPIVTSELLLLEAPARAARVWRPLARAFNSPPLLHFAGVAKSVKEWLTGYTTSWSALVKPLPANVHLLTAEALDDGALLVRLQHIYARGEDAELARNVTLDLRALFADFAVVGATEMSLSANMRKDEMHRLHWSVRGGPARQPPPQKTKAHTGEGDQFVVTLSPMEIRTFVLTVQR